MSSFLSNHPFNDKAFRQLRVAAVLSIAIAKARASEISLYVANEPEARYDTRKGASAALAPTITSEKNTNHS